MGKQEVIDALKPHLELVAVLDEGALQSDMEVLLSKINAGEQKDTEINNLKTIVETQDKAKSYQDQQIKILQDELASKDEEIASKNEKIDQLSKDIEEANQNTIELNKQLAATEAKKVSAKPTVDLNGKTYKVNFGTTIIYNGEKITLSIADIVANKQIKDGVSCVQALVDLNSKAIKEA